MKAYNTIKGMARKHQSIQLATLAASVRLAAKGHFDKVIAAIDEMLKTLSEEDKADIEKRDWCIAETHKNTKTMNAHKHQIEVLTLTIEKLENEKERMETEKAETEKE